MISTSELTEDHKAHLSVIVELLEWMKQHNPTSFKSCLSYLVVDWKQRMPTVESNPRDLCDFIQKEHEDIQLQSGFIWSKLLVETYNQLYSNMLAQATRQLLRIKNQNYDHLTFLDPLLEMGLRQTFNEEYQRLQNK